MSDSSSSGLAAAARSGNQDGYVTNKREKKKKRKEHASTGFSAATMRALSARLLTFYFRAPIKAFFRPRIEYVMKTPLLFYSDMFIVTWYETVKSPPEFS